MTPQEEQEQYIASLKEAEAKYRALTASVQKTIDGFEKQRNDERQVLLNMGLDPDKVQSVLSSMSTEATQLEAKKALEEDLRLLNQELSSSQNQEVVHTSKKVMRHGRV